MSCARTNLRAIASLSVVVPGLVIAIACSPAAPAVSTVVVAVPSGAPLPTAAPSSEPAPSCPVGMAFVAGGTLRAGSRTLPVEDFCLDITEVTAGAYAACVERGACGEEELGCDDAPTYRHGDLVLHPINCVSWAQADRYCRGAGKRLPLFEEWEWAAQGREEGRRFAWGGDSPAGDQMCWSRDTVRSGTCAVGTFPGSRTPQGIDDLFGGVWEWLAPEERNGAPNVARGGCWQTDTLDMLEGENAGAFQPGFQRNDVVGFRCAASRERAAGAAPAAAAPAAAPAAK